MKVAAAAWAKSSAHCGLATLAKLSATLFTGGCAHSDMVHSLHFTLGCREASAGRIPITLGGDHSIAVGTLQGILRAHPSSVVFWIDAHAGKNAALLLCTSLLFASHLPSQTSTRRSRLRLVRLEIAVCAPALHLTGNAHGMPLAFLLGLINASTMYMCCGVYGSGLGANRFCSSSPCSPQTSLSSTPRTYTAQPWFRMGPASSLAIPPCV